MSAALSAIEYLEKRAQRGSREKLLSVLGKAPDVEPEAADRLPTQRQGPETQP